MNGAPGTADRQSGEWHYLLLRMAGLLPDDIITDARALLAQGEVTEALALIAFAALTFRTPVWGVDAQRLRHELAAQDFDVTPLAELELAAAGESQDGRWVFTPVEVDTADEARLIPEILDLTAAGPNEPDAADRAAIAVIENEPGVVALWRVYRMPASPGTADDAGARRLFLVTILANDGTVDESEVAFRLQEGLIAAGERDPQVEVWPEGAQVPGYQTDAWKRSALLWAREPAVRIKVARAFDAVDAQEGPSFAATHPRVDDPVEVARLLEYLEGAPPVIVTQAKMRDVLDPVGDSVVPLTLRSDGVWIWSDVVGFYLDRHGLAPEPEFWKYLETRREQFPRLSAVGWHRARCCLLRQDALAGAVWSVPHDE